MGEADRPGEQPQRCPLRYEVGGAGKRLNPYLRVGVASNMGYALPKLLERGRDARLLFV